MLARSRSLAAATTSAAFGAGGAHAHVERTVETEREAARRLIELHGGDAEIEHDAVDGVKAGRARNMIEIGEALLDQRQAAIRLRNEIGAARDRFTVAVDGDDLAVGGAEQRAGVAAGAEGGVDKDAAIPRIQVSEDGRDEHGNVGGWSASDSGKAVAARRHSRAPSALRAAAWELSSALSSRTFWVASASSLWNRPGSQI